MDMRDHRWGAAAPQTEVLERPWRAAERYVEETPSAILCKLVAQAAEALDHDQEVARTLLRRAAVLLQSPSAPRGAAAQAPAQTALAPWQAKRVASHIDNNLDRPLPISQLANIAGLSSSYFSRAFKAAFGRTPHAFIIFRRVERARREMIEGREPLSQIALSCGFADQAHLARVFRRETGLAPSQWRRASGALGQSSMRCVPIAETARSLAV